MSEKEGFKEAIKSHANELRIDIRQKAHRKKDEWWVRDFVAFQTISAFEEFVLSEFDKTEKERMRVEKWYKDLIEVYKRDLRVSVEAHNYDLERFEREAQDTKQKLQQFRQEDLKVLCDEIERGCYKKQQDVLMEVIRLFDKTVLCLPEKDSEVSH